MKKTIGHVKMPYIFVILILVLNSYTVVCPLAYFLLPLIILPLLGGFGRELRSRNPWLEKWLVWLGGGVLVVIGSYRITLAF